jgi:hypothetical protein
MLPYETRNILEHCNEPVWLVSRRQVALQARKEQQTNLEGANPMPGQHRLQTT